jgi:hypothetical protein
MTIQRRNLLKHTAALTAAAWAGAGLTGCASMSDLMKPWTTLVDGATMKDLNGYTELGAGNWTFVDGALQGKAGKDGYLLTKDSYADFELRAEFWADEDANSGLFLRCQDRKKVTADNAYEVNIFDKRPDPSYGTGAIVNVSKISPMPKAAGRWNTYEITAKGDSLRVVLNGVQTADARDARFKSGPIALQSAAGTIRFRKVQVRAI